VLVVSNNPDERFNNGFLGGVQAALEPQGIIVKLIVNQIEPANSLELGEFLVHEYEQHRAMGIIALYFNDAALPFYHVLSKGINLISDIAHANLPVLPVVQTDNALHARSAGQLMKAWNKSDVLVTAFWPEQNNRRFEAFKEGFLYENPGVKVVYVNLGQELSRNMLHNFFTVFSRNKGVFAAEYSATHFIASYFYQYGIDVEKNLAVYDCENDRFEFRGLKPLAGVAPSFKDLGRRLGERLLYKIKNGAWQQPLVEKI
jgi:DNA-binding LacI/PurR family transcriptional regulator